MILNTTYTPSNPTTAAPSERLVAGTSEPNAILRGRVVDGVDSTSNSNQNRRAVIGDEQQQEQRQSSTLTQAQYEKVAAAHQQTIYDKPQGAQRLAISEYQSVQHAPKREEIQRLVGIDTFA
ncbi:hypothetical protein MHM98_12620 [Psychrobium sp. MM17-31]|uniref:hypothetical protein n=1 Tax=Psychrobium sp. MM17-31 TaxID=2917758 RepID=UPI001EF4D21F|nr:hypothetical protein [Psychrobium sp. MM17-31]MCG7532175.1 hypothetical protein [Psychrobium sp. MM17-31]